MLSSHLYRIHGKLNDGFKYGNYLFIYLLNKNIYFFLFIKLCELFSFLKIASICIIECSIDIISLLQYQRNNIIYNNLTIKY
jgi:hypothetical protein